MTLRQMLLLSVMTGALMGQNSATLAESVGSDNIIDNDEEDSTLQQLSYFLGLGMLLGLVVAVILDRYPGRVNDDEAKKDTDTKEKQDDNAGESSSSQEQQEQPQKATANDQAATNDDDFKEFLGKLQRKRRAEGEGSWTPHQQMNMVVYLVLFAVTGFVLVQEYDAPQVQFVGHYLKHHFSREARALGFHNDDDFEKGPLPAPVKSKVPKMGEL